MDAEAVRRRGWSQLSWSDVCVRSLDGRCGRRRVGGAKGGATMGANIECLAERARREGRAVSEEEGRKRLKAALRRIAKKRAEAIRERHAQTVPRQ